MEKKYSKNGSQKFKAFFKRNMYYIIMGVCILAIGAMITVAVIAQGGSGDIVDPDPNQQQPVDPNDPTDPTDTDPIDPIDPVVPIVFTSPVASNNIVREYVMNSIIHWSSLNQYAAHNGIDFGGEKGDSVVAAYAGVVISVTNDIRNGNVVKIDHGDGLVTVYESLGTPTVVVGQTVEAGKQIGTMDDTAGAELELGPHVHFAVFKNSKAVNPYDYLPIGDK